MRVFCSAYENHNRVTQTKSKPATMLVFLLAPDKEIYIHMIDHWSKTAINIITVEATVHLYILIFIHLHAILLLRLWLINFYYYRAEIKANFSNFRTHINLKFELIYFKNFPLDLNLKEKMNFLIMKKKFEYYLVII